ncbi:DUF1223 domain-containing protein [Fertoebacter nigrum]|uniref:DUF1223 domain-containing protein n=1 Tax=Fertoeibacter niger TaxID=2656921 RepID=A0A8X8GTQ9_9RHOB|nr:DUF1223 domain-containing protein [Fertoeibacter niger]NUB42927.1 DUF1223 domain-containing protein [Fertoeibacter niger]
MRQMISAACGLWLGLAATGHAQSQPVVVVELYTSQGCSSCPPADEHMAKLVADPRVIPLALHVDYWDYIGWKDKFASPDFTKRQKAYARAAGSRTIYTPQMIVAGQERVEGHQPDALAALIGLHAALATPVTLRLERSGGMLLIRAEADPPLGQGVQVQLVRYRPVEQTTIESGENAGKTVTYHNIVTSWQNLGLWSGTVPLEMEAVADGDEPVVVILQNEGPAGIVAAARLN